MKVIKLQRAPKIWLAHTHAAYLVSLDPLFETFVGFLEQVELRLLVLPEPIVSFVAEKIKEKELL